MTEASVGYPTILKQARKLPSREQHKLAEALLRPASGDEQVVIVSMRRLQAGAQARFLELMDQHNAGRLGPQERQELQGLVTRYEDLMLLNTAMLLKATYPQLFSASGRMRRTDLKRTLRQRTSRKTSP